MNEAVGDLCIIKPSEHKTAGETAHLPVPVPNSSFVE